MPEVEIKVGPQRPLSETELLERYKQADLPRKKNLYLKVLDLIRTYHARVGAGDWCFAEDMYEFITSTPAKILSYQFNNKETASYSIELFKAYKEYNLKIIQSAVYLIGITFLNQKEVILIFRCIILLRLSSQF